MTQTSLLYMIASPILMSRIFMEGMGRLLLAQNAIPLGGSHQGMRAPTRSSRAVILCHAIAKERILPDGLDAGMACRVSSDAWNRHKKWRQHLSPRRGSLERSGRKHPRGETP